MFLVKAAVSTHSHSKALGGRRRLGFGTLPCPVPGSASHPRSGLSPAQIIRFLLSGGGCWPPRDPRAGRSSGSFHPTSGFFSAPLPPPTAKDRAVYFVHQSHTQGHEKGVKTVLFSAPCAPGCSGTHQSTSLACLCFTPELKNARSKRKLQ